MCRWLLAAWGYKAFALLPVLNLFGLVLGVGMTILGKWLFIGRYKEGEHPIWGWHYIRHWLANQFVVVSNVCAQVFVYVAVRFKQSQWLKLQLA